MDLPSTALPPSSEVSVQTTSGGLRKVMPYWYPHTTMAKERWWGREILEVVSTEFRDRSTEYYVRPGFLCWHCRRDATQTSFHSASLLNPASPPSMASPPSRALSSETATLWSESMLSLVEHATRLMNSNHDQKHYSSPRASCHRGPDPNHPSRR
jgi:hypothetical protein